MSDAEIHESVRRIVSESAAKGVSLASRATARCCGQCSTCLGGCLKGFRFTFGKHGSFEPLPAGTTWDNPRGTPPMLLIDNVWVREDGVTG